MPCHLDDLLDYKIAKFKLRNKKSYVFAIYNLMRSLILPPGLLTAYLNCRGGFECFGFMAVMKDSKNQLSYVFLLVEESLSVYATTKDLGIFKSDVYRSFYFLLYVLDLMNTLYVYGIGISTHFTFAVDTSNNKKWRFRVENIGMFNCHLDKNMYMNHGTLISIINGFLKLFEYQYQALIKFFNNLIIVAEKLKKTNNKDYFAILTNMIEFEFKNSKDIIEYINGNNKTQCCIIQ